ncbi:PAS domain-containing protein [Cryptosporangium arvum]|uniref:PAS domain-containing protein n=1 Tax=Cryptosporangium arvum TaxID=80871 RepID=UPI00056D9E97|nr:PAS domain-containing protein [Cryptosporangium arvum]
MATDRIRREGGVVCPDGFASALYDTLQVGVAVFDDAGRLVRANRALRALYQLSDADHTVERLIRESLTDSEGTVLGPVHHPVDRALRGETVDGLSVRIVVPDGRARHADVNARPVLAPDGGTVGAVAAFRDTTLRERATRFRRCERLVARALAEATTVSDVGPALVRAVAGTLGWPHAQLWLVDEVADVLRLAAQWDAPGRTLEALLPPTIERGWGIGGTVWETGEPLWIPDLLSTDKVPTSNFPGRARRAHTVGVRAAVSVPVRDGRRVLGVLTCVADHREYNGERLVAQLGGIANQVGHFLSRRRAEELASELHRSRDDFRTLLRAFERDGPAARAARDDLLDLAALEEGRAGLRVAELDLVAVVAAAVAALSPSIRASVRVGRPERLRLRGDAGRLRDAVDALLGAVAGGDVYVRLKGEPGIAELTLIGVGVLSDDAAGTDPSAPVEAALGPRLALAVVRAHGGTVRVSTRYHPDVTFTVRLPVDGPPARPHRE